MPKFNGSDVKIFLVTGTAPGVESLITESTTASIEYSMETISTTTKDNNGFSSFIGGLKSGTMSVDGAVDYTEGAGLTNYDQLYAAWDGRTLLKVRWKMVSAANGSMIITQDALITSLSKTAPMEDMATFTVQFQLSGAPTVTSVAP